jgi:hypothetical protein
MSAHQRRRFVFAAVFFTGFFAGLFAGDLPEETVRPRDAL